MFQRDTILCVLEVARERLLAHYQSFTQEELETPCTESEVPDGAPWRPKDHLVHLLATERAFHGIIKRTLEGNASPVGFSRGRITRQEDMLSFVDRLNQKTIDAHRDDDVNTCLTELAKSRQDTLALMEQLTDEQLALPIADAASWWADGTIGGLLITMAHHEIVHVSWIEKALHKTSL